MGKSKKVKVSEKKSTLKEELYRLRKFPYGSKDHQSVMKRIQKEHLKKYSGQYILCTHGKFSNKENVISGEDLVVELFTPEERYKIQSPFSSQPYGLTISKSIQNSPFKNDYFYYHDRMYCEYNIAHRQVIVNSLILNKNHSKAIVMLEDNGKVSLIGGHVDFSQKDYNRSIEQVLFANMLKETNEEVGNPEYILSSIPQTPTHLVVCGNPDSEFYDNTHIFFMYVFELDDEEFEKQSKILKRNEKFHKPVVMSLDEIYKKTDKDSIKKIIRHIFEKDIEKESEVSIKEV